MKHYIPVVSIAGSDSSGGAGIQADLKTFSSLGCYGMSVITAITAQNTMGVTAVQPINPDVIAAQIDAVFSDIPPRAIKTGMLHNEEVIDVITRRLNHHGGNNLVVDPVMVSTSGSLLISPEAITALTNKLFPLALIVTPNRHEAATIAGSDNIADQIRAFRVLGCRNILLKGGDSDNSQYKTDIFLPENSDEVIELTSPAVNTANTHGTGCTLSSAIASYLAMGNDIITSVKLSKRYITDALRAGAEVKIGSGHGPVNHFHSPSKLIINED